MIRGRSGLLFLAVLALAVAGAQCRRAPSVVVHDLTDRLPVADWQAPSRQIVLFGAPAFDGSLVEGFYREAARGGATFLWAKEEAELALSWAEVVPRVALLDLAAYERVEAQRVRVTLNGTQVSELAVPAGRQRHRLELPPEAQREGENRLRFFFAGTVSPSRGDPASGDERRLAAAFHSLVVGAADDAGLMDLLGRGAPPALGVTEGTAGPAIVQLGPSAVSYAVRLPPNAELSFTPRLHPGARAAAPDVRMRVLLETRGSEPAELWSARPSAGAPGEAEAVSVPLPGEPGTLCRLSLEVEGTGRFVWALWEAPRVMGDEASSPLVAPAPGPAAQRAVGALRERLSDVNVLLLFLDAARADRTGAYGYSRDTTPVFDRLAGEGVLFEHAFTPAVYTLGAMSSVWTSQYPDRHHADLSFADRLPVDRPVLSELLSARGIHTAGFVANAMAGTAKGFDRGFHEFAEVHTLFEDLGSRAGSFRRVLPEWLQGNRDRRFFLYLHLREPHFPYDPQPPFDTRFGPDEPLTVEQRRVRDWYVDVNQGRVVPSPEELEHLGRLYDGNLAYADQEVGAILEALEAAELLEKTVVIVTSDHGEQLYEQGYISHSAQVLEPSIRVPFLLRLPQGIEPLPERVTGLVSLLDLAPTVMDVFGLPVTGPKEAPFQGTSLLDRLGGAAGPQVVLSRTVWERPVYSLRAERYKLIHNTRTGVSRLFDLQSDPLELQDIARREPVIAAWLRQCLLHEVRQLHPGPAGGSGSDRVLTRAQCENLKVLGYLASDHVCPES